MSSINKKSIKFLKDLRANNNKPWFTENKDKYLEMQADAKELMANVTANLNKHDRIERSKLFRTYRDVRFSKDKTPYNTHLSMSFHREKPYLRGGYYLRIEPQETSIVVGFWNPESSDMALIRGNIDMDAKSFRKVINKASIKKYWGELAGETVKTSPKGYSKDHPEIDLIRHKQFLFLRKFTPKETLDKDFPREVDRSFKAIRPFFDHMGEILGHNLNGEPLY